MFLVANLSRNVIISGLLTFPTAIQQQAGHAGQTADSNTGLHILAANKLVHHSKQCFYMHAGFWAF